LKEKLLFKVIFIVTYWS